MSRNYLKPIYFMLYNTEFSYDSFDKRMEMQKAIYLLQEMGVSVGDYDFLWYKHGPYSQNLQEDMFRINQEQRQNINFSQDTLKCIHKLHDLLNEEVDYPLASWAECLASIQYLKENVFSKDTSSKEIVHELTQRKKHLNNEKLNLHALDAVKILCAPQ